MAVSDSRDLLLIGGYPVHSRAGEAKALVIHSLKIDAYRATFERETAEWATTATTRSSTRETPSAARRDSPTPLPDVNQQPGVSAHTASIELPDPVTSASAPTLSAISKQRVQPAELRAKAAPATNSTRPEGEAADKRRPIPPLEDRFNLIRIGFIEKEYRFRDQAGKVAFTDKFKSITTSTESPAAIKAMVDRAAERGWRTVRLAGSPEFIRQGWIATTAQGLKPVGHEPTIGDRETATKERARLQVSQDASVSASASVAASTSQRPVDAIQQGRSSPFGRVPGSRSAVETGWRTPARGRNRNGNR